jgi:hypothetical protein
MKTIMEHGPFLAAYQNHEQSMGLEDAQGTTSKYRVTVLPGQVTRITTARAVHSGCRRL